MMAALLWVILLELQEPRRDPYGDPSPRGGIARMGRAVARIRASKEWKEKLDLDDLWTDLLSQDPMVVDRATCGFSALEKAAPFLRERLFPAPDERRFRDLVDCLSDISIDARERATVELGKAPHYLFPLEKTLEQHTDPEVETRIEGIMTDWEKARWPEARRRSRAITALQFLSSADAGKVLRYVAEISPIERERREAKTALERLCRIGERQ